jgi:hypothetical protein
MEWRAVILLNRAACLDLLHGYRAKRVHPWLAVLAGWSSFNGRVIRLAMACRDAAQLSLPPLFLPWPVHGGPCGSSKCGCSCNHSKQRNCTSAVRGCTTPHQTAGAALELNWSWSCTQACVLKPRLFNSVSLSFPLMDINGSHNTIQVTALCAALLFCLGLLISPTPSAVCATLLFPFFHRIQRSLRIASV